MDKLVQQMAGALFSLFASNMVHNINSDVPIKHKPGVTIRGDIWSQNDDKRHKLTGVKKEMRKWTAKVMYSDLFEECYIISFLCVYVCVCKSFDYK